MRLLKAVRTKPKSRPLVVAMAILGLLAGALSIGTPPALAQSQQAMWTALKSGEAFAMMRHALAPGTGDPPNFKLEDCTTQRNLSAEGRRQAAQIGARFRKAGITSASVYTSAWCRCRETAKLLGLGPAEDLSALLSFYKNDLRTAPQTAALRSWLSTNWQGGRPLVLVTHQVNIQALTGVDPPSGGIVVVRRASNVALKVMGRL